MFAVIFEVRPKTKERWDEYLALAGQLKPKLEAIDGFVDNERFGSKRDKGRLLSLSIWRDEKAVIRWRTQGEHHGAQEKGRFEVFEDYHLRVGQIAFDSDPTARLTVEAERRDESEVGTSKMVALTEIVAATPDGLLATSLGFDPAAAGLADHELFESITDPGKRVLMTSWLSAEAGRAWKPARPPRQCARCATGGCASSATTACSTAREAPQFYPAAERTARGSADRAP